uniref:Peroxisomal membrane protein PEX14 n=1 Tax=Eptatretus burgeri TaxID=7764 RepID=A0A8C4PYJ0_EPTBU
MEKSSETNEVEIAVKFLKNSRVQNSPLDAKKSFLRKKGLCESEIDESLKRSGDLLRVDGQSPSPFHTETSKTHQGHRPVTWTRRFMFTVAGAGFLIGFYQLYKICQTWFGRVEGTMDNINSTVSRLQSAVDDFARTMATQAQIQRLPSQQDQSLGELKAEVHSLKSLLLSRKHFPPPPSSILPSWQVAKSAIACDLVTDADNCSIIDPRAEELPIIETESNRNDAIESAEVS